MTHRLGIDAPEELVIRLIHGREVVHRRQEDVDFDNGIQPAARCLEDGGQILDRDALHDMHLVICSRGRG